MGFRRFPLAPELQRGIEAAGYADPRPIQLQTIPAVLAGRDVLGLAPTGTGKTAAFLLPILQRLLERRAPGPRVLVVAPTRELAQQIQAELEQLASFTKVSSATVFGGVPVGPQVRALRRRPDVLVACPGRLLDLHARGEVPLGGIEVLVLDEADHMFDMGFLPDVKRILAALPKRRQNLLFSATMPREIRGLADAMLQRPRVVELGGAPPATIEHALCPVHSDDKVELLRRLLDGPDFTSGIVFLRTKRRAQRLAVQLDRLGHAAVSLQGNMSQSQRVRAMNGFREGRYDVLVATDIAARGIDVPGVSHVINFDVPTTPDAYTHRIGRTGRAERSGKAFTFAAPEDAALVRAIEQHLRAPIPRLRLEGFQAPRELAAVGAGSADARLRAAGSSGKRPRDQRDPRGASAAVNAPRRGSRRGSAAGTPRRPAGSRSSRRGAAPYDHRPRSSA